MRVDIKRRVSKILNRVGENNIHIKIMDEKFKISELTEDEAGKLHGGFSSQSPKLRSELFANNGNCIGGGWGDSNVNCTGTCKSCNVNQEQEQE